MSYNDRVGSGLGWQYIAAATAVTGDLFTFGSARRIVCNGAGDLYLIPVGGVAGVGTLFMAGVLAGQQFDIQCDGIGASTTCTNITAIR
jgi:hypothetical protein